MTHKDILLVEDNPDDVELTRLAFEEANVANRMVVAGDGAEALDYLFARGKHAGRDPSQLPAIVLLDLKLPRMSGLEVLEWMRTQPPLNSVRTVVLTSSSEECDIRRAHALGAAAYVVKPVDFIGLRGVIEAVLAFWEDPSSSAQAHLGRFAASVPAPR